MPGSRCGCKDADLPRVGKGLKAATGHPGRAAQATAAQPARATSDSRHCSPARPTTPAFARADLVIEAVFEDLDGQATGAGRAREAVAPEAVIATNTSTIPIADIAAGSERPERVLGMHFFSPVERMPLLEVIPHEGTSARSIATAVRFGRRMGKTVIVVGDLPGFWVNRILAPYLNEAGILLMEGAPMDVIDRVMTRFGFPVGPITLLDEVGLDVAQKAAGVMHEAFGERLAPSDFVRTHDGRRAPGPQERPRLLPL